MITAAPRSLAAAQQVLLDTLFARPGSGAAQAASDRLEPLLDAAHPQTARGLSAYRAHGHAQAARALAAAYPVVSAVLGEQSLDMLARALWHHHPPGCGDLARWGADLPAFVQDDPQLVGLPWLADVARVEWALHQAASAPDRWSSADSFALLQAADPTGLRLRLAPGLCLVQSPWPVVSIVTAHTQSRPPLDEAWQRCRDGVRETALVWRAGLQPKLALADPAASVLLGLLQQGADLPRALEGACTLAEDAGAPFDFSAWLRAAVQDGVVLGAHLDPPHATDLETPE
jgi:hypothetical protein